MYWFPSLQCNQTEFQIKFGSNFLTKLLQGFIIFRLMRSTTPNMNIAVGIVTNVATFGGFTDTFVLVAFYVCKFPDIGRIMTFNAYFRMFSCLKVILYDDGLYRKCFVKHIVTKKKSNTEILAI